MITLRNIERCARNTIPRLLARSCTSEQKLVDVVVDDKSGIATVTMQRAPVNAMNVELLSTISKILDDLNRNKSRGMILTSASNRVFSAGLDIMVMHKPKEDQARALWMAIQEVWLQLYGSTFPTVAAVNGHAPAGGCLLAMSCEYRVMVRNFNIGLNEAQLGIIAPKWCVDCMRNTIGVRQTELALTQGKLFTTDEALKVGLIDEIADDKNDALVKSEGFLKRFAKVHRTARNIMKTALRSKDLKDLMDHREEDVQSFLSLLKQPQVQQSIEKYMKFLKRN